MNKLFILAFIFCASYPVRCQILSLNDMLNDDQITFNYSISMSEFGSIHEGIIVTKENNKLKAVHILYKYGIKILSNGLVKVKQDSFTEMDRESVISRCKKMHNNIHNNIIIKEWLLKNNQVQYLNSLLKEIRDFRSKGYGNAPEYYAVFSKYGTIVALDRTGQWDKNKEIKKYLNLN